MQRGRARLISVSQIPGGNPTALAKPELWATVYMICPSCGHYFCDLCLKEMPAAQCTDCGVPLCREDALAEMRQRIKAVYDKTVEQTNQALDWQDSGRFDDALPVLLKMTPIFRKLGKWKDVSACLTGLALNMIHRKKYQEAEEYLAEDEQLCRDKGWEVDLGYNLFHRGRLKALAGDAGQAKSYLQQCVPLLTGASEYTVQLQAAKDILEKL
jgi:hypothetical protein